jgi:hypothetical protein
MQKIVRETLFFLTILIILALGVHMDRWVSAPVEHWEGLSSHVMPWHPVIYAAIAYVVLGMFRLVLLLLLRLFRRS